MLIKAQEERFLPNREKVNQEYKPKRTFERKGNNRNRSTFESANDRDQGNQEKVKMPHIRCKSNLVTRDFRDQSPIHMNRTINETLCHPSLMMTYEGFKRDFKTKKLTLQDVQPVKNQKMMQMTSKTQGHSPMNQFGTYLPYINVDLQDITKYNGSPNAQSKTPDSFSEDITADGFKTAHARNNYSPKKDTDRHRIEPPGTDLSMLREVENSPASPERNKTSLSKMTVKVDKVIVNDKSREEYSKNIRNIALENQEMLQSLGNQMETEPTNKNGLNQQSSFYSQYTNDLGVPNPIPRLQDFADNYSAL